MIAKLKDIPIDKSLCAYCQKEFPRGPLAVRTKKDGCI